jgi:hypothetical protein
MIDAKPVAHTINLDGAARTAVWLQAAVAD